MAQKEQVNLFAQSTSFLRQILHFTAILLCADECGSANKLTTQLKAPKILQRNWNMAQKVKGKNKSSDHGISLNRSQYKSCSTGYNPLTSNQVVYK